MFTGIFVPLLCRSTIFGSSRNRHPRTRMNVDGSRCKVVGIPQNGLYSLRRDTRCSHFGGTGMGRYPPSICKASMSRPKRRRTLLSSSGVPALEATRTVAPVASQSATIPRMGTGSGMIRLRPAAVFSHPMAYPSSKWTSATGSCSNSLMRIPVHSSTTAIRAICYILMLLPERIGK